MDNVSAMLSDTIKWVKDFNSRNMLTMIMLFILLFFTIFYIVEAVNRGKNNCETIRKYSPQAMKSISDEVKSLPIKKTFIKTAYNCCCTGGFKNDYVDGCALTNCAKQGVRALDFTVYSLHGKPVISASTLPSKRYKEMYNSLPFHATMTKVKQLFLEDPANCTNTQDPLFLIFRIQSDRPDLFSKMAEALQTTFGYGSSVNRLFSPAKDFDNVTIGQLMGKVVILVERTGPKIQSILSPLVALELGTLDHKIYRETDAYDVLIAGQEPNKDHVNILYPDYQASSNNYDYETVGIQQGFQFIGMNFQLEDLYLDTYKSKFDCSILAIPVE